MGHAWANSFWANSFASTKILGRYGIVSEVKGDFNTVPYPPLGGCFAPNVWRIFQGGQVKEENGSQDWVSVGLVELARGGVDGVRVEVLAERLGVTKGGFYRRFKDRRALLNAMLETWRDGRVIAIERHAEAGGESPAERIQSLTKLYTERANEQGMAIELAIRQWARNDPMAAAAAA